MTGRPVIDDTVRVSAQARPDDVVAVPGRVAWIDSARGIGIVLVVAGHALGGLIDSPLGQFAPGFRVAFFAIYTFHMPLFLLLSGMLVERRIARGQGAFLRGLIPSLVWPYFLWSIIQLTIIYLLGSLVNRPAEHYWSTIVALPWQTVSQFWFLHTLVLLHVLATVLLPRIGREGMVMVGLVAKSVAMLLPIPPVLKFAMVHFLWYAIGIWLGTGGVQRLIVDRQPMVRWLVLPLFAATLIAHALAMVGRFGADVPFAIAMQSAISNLAWRLPVMGAAVAGSCAAIGLASLASGPVRDLLSALGRATMPVFLMHVLFIAGTRILLIHAGLHDPLVIVGAAIALGLGGPLAVQGLIRSSAARRWLGFG